ncbi:MAG: FliM/FliN family flagellar motor switch protein [Bryobacteraceae bacterium]|jgi:flagellar motor switch protein FliM
MSSHSQLTGAGTGSPGPPAYDVCTPGNLPVDQIGFVEAIHRQFLKSLARRLSDSLETPVGTDLAGIEQMQFPDFLSSCNGDACLIPLSAGPHGGRAILELSPGFVHRALGILIGAPQSAPGTERRVTGIERHILHECFDGIVRELRDAWASHGVGFDPEPTAQGDEQAQPVTEGSAVVINSLLTIGGAEDSMRLAVPALLVRLAVKDASPTMPAPQAVRPQVLEAMREAAVRVEAVLGGASLRMRDLLTLETGRVLTLGPPANCSVECVINGVSKFRGELVSNGRNQAFQIGAPIECRTNPRD